MATYRCLASGNTVTFTMPHDIESMKGHGGYVLVDETGDAAPQQEESRALPMTAPVKRMGRPPKVKATQNG